MNPIIFSRFLEPVCEYDIVCLAKVNYAIKFKFDYGHHMVTLHNFQESLSYHRTTSYVISKVIRRVYAI